MIAPTLEQWSSIAQIGIGLITSIGVIASLYMSGRALRELQIDRHLRQKPFLSFEPGGWRIPVRFVKAGYYVPGINPEFAVKSFGYLPPDAESVRIDEERAKRTNIGKLRNFGLGPAIGTHVAWLAKKVVIGDQSFDIDDNKLKEPRYSISFNNLPAVPEHIMPQSESGLTRMPTFIDKDCEKHIKEAEGILLIHCEDVFGNKHVTLQSFWMRTNYSTNDNGPYVHITFKDIIHVDKEEDNKELHLLPVKS
jgi:hypothetical protein